MTDKVDILGNIYDPSYTKGGFAGNVLNPRGTCQTLKASFAGGASATYVMTKSVEQIANLYGTPREPNPVAGRVYDPGGLAPAILALGGGNSQPIILTTNNTMQTRQERIDHKWMPDGSIRGFDSDKGSGISEEQYTATAAPSDTVSTDPKRIKVLLTPQRVEYRIRKITPREAFRLMDVDEENIDRIQNHTWVTTLKDGTEKINRISKTRAYALAGNSIVVARMERIFKNLFFSESRNKEVGEQLTIFDVL
ncbi:MAG: hypothetical protein LIP02_00155 [Bacteroidales bacterium]|nr:hypothetical protein [Bacteroidales bacterium]